MNKYFNSFLIIFVIVVTFYNLFTAYNTQVALTKLVERTNNEVLISRQNNVQGRSILLEEIRNTCSR